MAVIRLRQLDFADVPVKEDGMRFVGKPIINAVKHPVTINLSVASVSIPNIIRHSTTVQMQWEEKFIKNEVLSGQVGVAEPKAEEFNTSIGHDDLKVMTSEESLVDMGIESKEISVMMSEQTSIVPEINVTQTSIMNGRHTTILNSIVAG